MTKILFISHDAHLTGAPILLINLIKLIKEQGKPEIKIVVKNGYGSLLDDFEVVAPTLVWKHAKTSHLIAKIENKLRSKLNLASKNHKKIQEWITESDVVISNTITNGDFLQAFDFSKPKLIASYIHELEIATNYYTSKELVNEVIKASHRILVPAIAVATHLINNLGVDGQKINTLNYYIPNPASSLLLARESSDIFVVGLVGTVDWRKGADVFPIIVSQFFKKYPTATLIFVWKGANNQSIECERINYELGKMKLSDKVKFEATSKDVSSFYQSIDVLLLSSKEDPYPLVVLEAASYAKPCICFADAGGAPEFIQQDAGDVVPYLDMEVLAYTLFSYYNDKEKGIAKGKVAYERYKALHQNQQLILDQFNKAIA